MLNIKKVYEDAVVGASAAPSSGGMVDGGTNSDNGLVGKGTGTEDVIGKFDPSKGVMGKDNFHIPKNVLGKGKILKRLNKNNYADGMKILKEGELKHSYTGDAYKMSLKIYSTVDEVHIDELNFVKDFGFAWKLNNKGYIHVYMPNRVKMNGETLHFSIKHCMLTDKNELKDIGTFGIYKSKEEALKVVKEQCKQ